MKPRRVHEVDSLAELDRLLAAGARTAAGWRFQGLDLTGHEQALAALDVTGAVVLGGRLSPSLEDSLRERGALVFPSVPDVPFDAYRSTLYSAAELYDAVVRGGDYADSHDARVYAWSRDETVRADVAATLATALHDHAVDDALDEAAQGRRLVGVMGGHRLTRDEPGFRSAATLGAALAQHGLSVVTGGGPGAMEAANLGARAAGAPALLGSALDRLATAPDYRASVTDWARVGLEVAAGLADPPVPTIGVPTWFYGHEPANVFATDVAKYFRNALREDTLLRLCDAGVVFLPGSAGTVQEVFQDACENYYSTEPAPMVLWDAAYWTERLPVWPLLRRLAEGTAMADRIHLVDVTDEAGARAEVAALLAG